MSSQSGSEPSSSLLGDKRKAPEDENVVSKASMAKRVRKEPTEPARNWLQDKDNVIVFGGGHKNAYAWLSNFYQAPFVVDGKNYHHVEGYFQAAKFINKPAVAETIRQCVNPVSAKRAGRKGIMTKEELTLWDKGAEGDARARKLVVMKDALILKFGLELLREKLLGTGDKDLVEQVRNDKYWGCGNNGTGENWLGRLLMEVRAELRAGQNNTEG